MKKFAPIFFALLPMAALADVQLFEPALESTICREGQALAAQGPSPLKLAIRTLALPADPTAQAAAVPAGALEVLRMAPMPDNTWRGAFIDCDKLEVYVSARGGVVDTTRWYGPYKVADLMSARGAAEPPFR